MQNIEALSAASCRDAALTKYHYRRMVDEYIREYSAELACPGALRSAAIP